MKAYGESGEQVAPRSRSPTVFIVGAVQTKARGPGLYEPSRLVIFVMEIDVICRSGQGCTSRRGW